MGLAIAESWQRADIIAGIAAIISGLALIVSLRAQHYTKLQTRIAMQTSQQERESKWPAVEPSVFMRENEPGWCVLRLDIRNRLDTAVVCEILYLHKPTGIKGAAARDFYGSYLVTNELPSRQQVSTAIELEVHIPAKGARALYGVEGLTSPDDERQIDVLLSTASISASKNRTVLLASIKVRRSNEMASFAEIMIETKMPPVSASTET